MKKLTYMLFTFLIIVAINGCSDSDSIVDDPGGDFDLKIEAIDLPPSTTPFTVVYTATATGDGKITKIDYYGDNNNTITVNNPQMPWGATLNVNGGKRVYMYAKGNSSTGKVEIICTATAGSLVITYTRNVTRN